MQPAHAKAQRRLQAGNPIRRIFKLDFLLMHGVGRVIGGDGVHDAIQNGLDHGVSIKRGPQRRVHLRVRVVEAHVLFREEKMVRSHFASDAQAAAPGLAHRSQRRGGGCVRHVQVDAGVAQLGDQPNIALHQAGLSLSRHAAQPQLERHRSSVHAGALRKPCVFSVLDHAQSHARRGNQRLAHDVVLQYRVAVVRHGDGARGLERGIVVDGLAL